MKDEDIQKHLTYITKIKNLALNFNKILGVTAIWKDDTAYLSFYFDEEPSENELEVVADMCTEIIAQMPKGMLEDNYIILKDHHQLPEKFLAYRREEGSS